MTKLNPKEEGAFMNNSIQHFATEGIAKLSEICNSYSDDLTKIAELVYGITDVVTKLGLSIIAEEFEAYDEILRKRKALRSDWNIVRRDKTKLITSLGEVEYFKTLFINKRTGVSSYLLDDLMRIESHTRITEDAIARIFEEAVETSYRKGGEHASITDVSVSKQTVKNKIHSLDFPEILGSGEKRQVEYLYIDADEDHVSLQYLEKKGDIKKPRTNTAMPKLAYVYEGIDNEEDGRPKLINKKHFGGMYEGENGVKKFWNEVYAYIESTYDVEKIKNIYINGDGAAWIKSGTNYIAPSKFVLDKYHMHKYVTLATAHLGDSRNDAISEIYRAIHKRKKKMAEETFDKILAVTESESKSKAVAQAKGYILENWAGILRAMKSKDKNIQCSAEGHISHIYADRMSSRPLGWSKVGVDKMSHLRVYWLNGGNMLDLVRYQKQERKLAAGAEEVIRSAGDIIADEYRSRRVQGNYADLIPAEVPSQIKKVVAIRHHIWDL